MSAEIIRLPRAGAPANEKDLAMTDWIPVAAMEDIPRLGARVVKPRDGGTVNIAVFRNADDEMFALADQCPHKGGPLSQGIVHGRHVTCPLHGWNIALTDGNAVAPDMGCAGRYAVKVEDGVVFIKL